MTPIITALMGFFILSGAAFASAAQAGNGESAAAPSYQVTLTGYNAVPDQTDADPDMTASGAFSNPAIVAARSRDLADELPFGTVIAMEPDVSSSPDCGWALVGETVGLRVVADTMNARMRDKVDILFGTGDTVVVDGRHTNAATALGVCRNARVVVVGHIDMAMMPRTQRELADMLGKDSAAFALAK